MSAIKDIHNPWRDKMRLAQFRSAIFHVEAGARSSGRRIVTHTYPKRNDPYSEDMGRSPISFHVTGYLIGPEYLSAKDKLIAALEEDGPGTLQMPWPYAGKNLEVMAGAYTITEARERGGLCAIEMEFVEFGKPGFAGVAPRPTADTVADSSQVQTTAASVMSGQVGVTPSAAEVDKLWDTSIGRVPVEPPEADVEIGDLKINGQ